MAVTLGFHSLNDPAMQTCCAVPCLRRRQTHLLAAGLDLVFMTSSTLNFSLPLLHRRDFERLFHAFCPSDAALTGRAAGEAFSTATCAVVNGGRGLGLPMPGNHHFVPATIAQMASKGDSGLVRASGGPVDSTHNVVFAFGA